MKDISGHLKWRCRRGMLELDVLFEQFLNTIYVSLDDQQRTIFLQLLDENDQDIQGWVFVDATSTPPKYRELIGLLRG